MNIDVSKKNETTIVRPNRERLDIEVAGEFRSALFHLIDEGHRRFVIDLGQVSFIDSSGLGALVSALKALKRGQDAPHADVRLAGAQPPVVSLLEIIRLNRVFSSYPDVEQATRSYQ